MLITSEAQRVPPVITPVVIVPEGTQLREILVKFASLAGVWESVLGPFVKVNDRVVLPVVPWFQHSSIVTL